MAVPVFSSLGFLRYGKRGVPDSAEFRNSSTVCAEMDFRKTALPVISVSSKNNP